jgi:hypothetical protein
MAGFTQEEQQRLRETVSGILNGKKMKEHRVVKHKWNFEPPQMLAVSRHGGTLTAKGRFTHYLRIVKDDVVNYEFILEGGQVKDIKVNYEDKGWSSAVSGALKLLAPIIGRPELFVSAELLNSELGKGFGGGVQEEAQLIVAHIAVALNLKEQRR